MKKYSYLFIFVLLLTASPLLAQEEPVVNAQISETAAPNGSNPQTSEYAIFDDKMLLFGYAKKYKDLPKEILLEMIKDDTLNTFKTAAAARALREKFGSGIVSAEK